ncbi:hypothetical protein [Streptomyces sp. ITFR-6]|uniref:hypothetical protein n=1 Tax=Streptomyces sp. ITFR-6 TaxID=3075197 RepID=UPI00288A0050|nr:hypothetical protein [Streptomyces sp. ITFR-6]WNI27679.1 hypothetical protein RLT59_02005 [Streptomyces sp. ITFR-6]
MFLLPSVRAHSCGGRASGVPRVPAALDTTPWIAHGIDRAVPATLAPRDLHAYGPGPDARKNPRGRADQRTRPPGVQGHWHAERRANGCREYDDRTVETVRRVRALPTRIMRQVLPCTHDAAILRPCPGVLASLRDQLDILDQRAAELETVRRLLRQTIAATESTAWPRHNDELPVMTADMQMMRRQCGM